MNVVGIDPAPQKGLQVFSGDGGDRYVKVDGARSYVAELHTSQSDVLVCWDAPLTGPPSNVLIGCDAMGSAYTQRPIESFFQREAYGFKSPKGISVRGYSGCPHWTISRSLIGLPRVGPFDRVEGLPFTLLTADQPPTRGHNIVEVHPALALWLWCKKGRRKDADWEYKKNLSTRGSLWNKLTNIAERKKNYVELQKWPAPNDNVPNDDMMDARVAWLLGRLWLANRGDVVLLGNADTGAMLVPRVDGLEDAFQEFLSRSSRRQK